MYVRVEIPRGDLAAVQRETTLTWTSLIQLPTKPAASHHLLGKPPNYAMAKYIFSSQVNEFSIFIYSVVLSGPHPQSGEEAYQGGGKRCGDDVVYREMRKKKY